MADTYTTVDVNHESGSVVAVTIDGDTGEILRIEKAAYDPENINTPNNTSNGTNYY